MLRVCTEPKVCLVWVFQLHGTLWQHAGCRTIVLIDVQASGNVAGVCNWAEAMCTYHNVAKEVEPKIETLHAAEMKLKIATKEKDAALEQLLVVQIRLDAMQVYLWLHTP